jgi:hypothetical protein
VTNIGFTCVLALVLLFFAQLTYGGGFGIAALVTTNPPLAGANGNELVIAGAPVMVGAGDIAVCGTSGDLATARRRLSCERQLANSDGGVHLGDNAYPSGAEESARFSALLHRRGNAAHHVSGSPLSRKSRLR